MRIFRPLHGLSRFDLALIGCRRALSRADFICAFNRVAIKYRDRFPSVPAALKKFFPELDLPEHIRAQVKLWGHAIDRLPAAWKI